MNFHINKLVVKIVLGFAMAFLGRIALAQSNVQSHDMVITYHKTSSVIFPAVIKSVDRGSKDVIAQKAKEVGNVLQLKAGRENFPETNLTVITADGILHHFTLNYIKNPDKLTLELGPNGIVTDPVKEAPVIFQAGMTESDMEEDAMTILDKDRTFIVKREKEYKIGLFLNGIYIKDNIMFYHFTMNNTSNIDYDVDFLRFYIRDQEKVKRTATQELDIKPLQVFGNDKFIKGNSSQEIVYALSKFTIPDSKNLVIEMFEHNGGRHLDLAITNKTIVNARALK